MVPGANKICFIICLLLSSPFFAIFQTWRLPADLSPALGTEYRWTNNLTCCEQLLWQTCQSSAPLKSNDSHHPRARLLLRTQERRGSWRQENQVETVYIWGCFIHNLLTNASIVFANEGTHGYPLYHVHYVYH